MDGVSTITQVKRDGKHDKEEKSLSQEEIFERRMDKISQIYPLSQDHEISWLVANDECFSRLMKVISQINENAAFVNLDENLRIKRKSVFPVLKGICMACQAVDNVLSGTSNHAMCITKVEGEVEREEEKAGFAALGNAAIASHYALSKNAGKIAIVEFDLDHQDMGSRELIAKTPEILLISVNVAGKRKEDEEESADNYKSVTIPKIAHRKDIEKIMEEKVFAEIGEFKPDLIFLATEPSDCGDSTWPEGFKCEYVNKNLIELADKYANGKYILALEGSVDEESFMKCQASFSQKSGQITS